MLPDLSCWALESACAGLDPLTNASSYRKRYNKRHTSPQYFPSRIALQIGQQSSSVIVGTRIRRYDTPYDHHFSTSSSILSQLDSHACKLGPSATNRPPSG